MAEQPDTIDPRLDKMYMDSFLKVDLPALEAGQLLERTYPSQQDRPTHSMLLHGPRLQSEPDIFEQTYEVVE